MKSPISYYGGKANMIQHLLPLIPEHIQYVEPFCGGASLFWAKEPSQHEAINDYDLRVANFWQVLKTNFDELQYLIQTTLHHEAEYYRAKSILQNPIENKVEYAWAFWVQTQMSFSYKIFGGFAFKNERGSSETTNNKRVEFTDVFFNRIKEVEIFNRDAIKLIKMKDSPDTFFYFDPPYAESDCGHYEALKGVYYQLLDMLPTLKGKWLMSSYPSQQLKDLRDANNWNTKDTEQNLAVSGKHNTGKTKIECLTWNYQLQTKESQRRQLSLFG